MPAMRAGSFHDDLLELTEAKMSCRFENWSCERGNIWDGHHNLNCAKLKLHSRIVAVTRPLNLTKLTESIKRF